jgi:hypothetical protein
MIKLIITYRELPPFTELGRQRKSEMYPSFKTMVNMTCTDSWRLSKIFEFNCCKYHITLLFYNLVGDIETKLKFKSYNEFGEYCLKCDD